jgi:hypothetical protein
MIALKECQNYHSIQMCHNLCHCIVEKTIRNCNIENRIEMIVENIVKNKNVNNHVKLPSK